MPEQFDEDLPEVDTRNIRPISGSSSGSAAAVTAVANTALALGGIFVDNRKRALQKEAKDAQAKITSNVFDKGLELQQLVAQDPSRRTEHLIQFNKFAQEQNSLDPLNTPAAFSTAVKAIGFNPLSELDDTQETDFETLQKQLQTFQQQEIASGVKPISTGNLATDLQVSRDRAIDRNAAQAAIEKGSNDIPKATTIVAQGDISDLIKVGTFDITKLTDQDRAKFTPDELNIASAFSTIGSGKKLTDEQLGQASLSLDNVLRSRLSAFRGQLSQSPNTTPESIAAAEEAYTKEFTDVKDIFFSSTDNSSAVALLDYFKASSEADELKFKTDTREFRRTKEVLTGLDKIFPAMTTDSAIQATIRTGTEDALARIQSPGLPFAKGTKATEMSEEQQKDTLQFTYDKWKDIKRSVIDNPNATTKDKTAFVEMAKAGLLQAKKDPQDMAKLIDASLGDKEVVDSVNKLVSELGEGAGELVDLYAEGQKTIFGSAVNSLQSLPAGTVKYDPESDNLYIDTLSLQRAALSDPSILPNPNNRETVEAFDKAGRVSPLFLTTNNPQYKLALDTINNIERGGVLGSVTTPNDPNLAYRETFVRNSLIQTAIPTDPQLITQDLPASVRASISRRREAGVTYTKEPVERDDFLNLVSLQEIEAQNVEQLQLGQGDQIGDVIDSLNIKEVVKAEEGSRPTAYKDTEGVTTIGIGFNLEDPTAANTLRKAGVDKTVDELKEGASLTEQEQSQLFDVQFEVARKDAAKVVPSFNDHPPEVQGALVNMSFQLGADRLGQFKKFSKALDSKDYFRAISELRNSKLAKQTPNRVNRIVTVLKDVAFNELAGDA